jgi:hypothetical protein
MFDKATYPRSAMDMNNDRGANQRMPDFAKGASFDFGSFNKTGIKGSSYRDCGNKPAHI